MKRTGCDRALPTASIANLQNFPLNSHVPPSQRLAALLTWHIAGTAC